VDAKQPLSQNDIDKLIWLFSDAPYVEQDELQGWFIGPRREMLTPWSTNAVEITQNMGITGIARMEEFIETENENAEFDPMLQRKYKA
jgi:phosphoribosylformylglycinamidine synthase